jgi:hypothetical protein
MNAKLRPASLVFGLALLLNLCPPLSASSVDSNLPDAQALMQLEQRAQQAKPREQCFLYAELVHTMTEIAGKQMLAGDADQASATLKKVEHYAQLIHLNLADDTKRLKNAEMLMHHTTYRLSEYLHQASSEDQATLKATLKQLDQVQDEILNQVFKK